MTYNDDLRGPNRAEMSAALKWGLALIALAVILLAVGSYAHFALGWATAPAQVYSVDNTRAQWQFAYAYDEDLKSATDQYCTARKSELDAIAAKLPQATIDQRTNQRTAREDNYNRIRGDYDARLRDAFQAKLVKPSDVPERAPTLAENVAIRCR